MKPFNPPDNQPPHSSSWVVLDHEQLEELLNHAHATYTTDKPVWVGATTKQFAAASNHATHHGGFILLTDIPPVMGGMHALSLVDSLDWVAYETLVIAAEKDSPAAGAAAWRKFMVGNLHPLLLKQERVKIRQAAAEIWARFRRETQIAPGSNADSPSP